MNTDGTGTIVSESGVQISHYHCIIMQIALVRANTPLRFVLSLITSPWSLF